MMDVNKFKHITHLKVRFSDLDAMRHVNNASYLTYLEEARINYFNDLLNLPNNNLAFGAVVARIEINYLKPLELGEKLKVFTRVSKIGFKSADLENLITTERNGKLIIAAEAVTKLVGYNFKNKETMAIPEEIKKIIETYEN